MQEMYIKNLNSKFIPLVVSMACVLTASTVFSAEDELPPPKEEFLPPFQWEEANQGVEEPAFNLEDLELGRQGREAERGAREDISAEVDEEEESRLAAMINKYVEFGGAIEAEALWFKNFEDDTGTDISLETAELDFEITFCDWAIGLLGIEWEPDDDFFTVKEAFVTFGLTECNPYFLTVGRLFVPFGISTGAVVGDTLSISDPLTIEIFEAREDVVMLGFEKNGFHTAAYVYNGDTNKGGGNDHIEQWGATIRYGKESPHLSYSVGLDFIGNVFDSDELQEAFPESLEDDYAPGVALHARYYRNGFSFIAEYNGAFQTASFTQDDEDLRLAPKAWQIEIGYEREICCKPTYIAFNYSQSHDLHGEFPRVRYLATVGRWLHENILLALEYGHDEDYSESKGGTGKTADTLLCQLTYEW